MKAFVAVVLERDATQSQLAAQQVLEVTLWGGEVEELVSLL